MKKDNISRFLSLSIIFFLISLTINNCSKNKTEPVDYKKANLKTNSIDFISKELIELEDAVYTDDKIFAIDSRHNIWRIDIGGKNIEEKIFNNGVGPDEIYKAKRLIINEGYCWVISALNWDKIYNFNINDEKPKYNMFRLPTGMYNIDSLFPLTSDRVAAVCRFWKDNLLKIIDKEKGVVQAAGERSYIKAMERFNVNEAEVKKYKDNVYVIQYIDPFIQVFSLDPLKPVDRIVLSPPFFTPVPGEYNVPKNDIKKHFAWMASWTRVYQMFIDKDWILIRYIRGYKVNYYYELINLVERNKRFFIDATKEYIIGFKVVDGKFMVMSCEEDEDETRWKKGEIII